MAYSTNEALQQNSEFKANYARWKFLFDSYMGGADYARGEYLTRYVYETNNDYMSRIAQTPLDNHAKSIVSIYNSFIFAKPPKRDFMELGDDPLIQDILDDADMDGRSWDHFMREVSTISSVFGHAWVVVDKPEVALTTRAEEIATGVRPYVNLFTPMQVVDWKYERLMNGRFALTHLKVLTDQTTEYQEFACYYPEYTEIIRYSNSKQMTEVISSTPNPLGYVAAVCVYSTRSFTKGIGISDIGDIADVQRAIYDELSEIEQLIRISNHPSLVSTQEVQASAGAGARIIIPENQAGDIKPYLLQPTAQSLDGIRASIKDKVEAINQMANVGSVRATTGRNVSGVALETEFRLLNAHLTQKADNLELAEEQIWTIIYDWMGYTTDFVIDYPESFNTRDRMSDLALLEKAKTVYALPTTGNPVLDTEINKAIAVIAVEDEEGFKEVYASIEQQEVAQGIEEAE
jgi:hypothetical protein